MLKEGIQWPWSKQHKSHWNLVEVKMANELQWPTSTHARPMHAANAVALGCMSQRVALTAGQSVIQGRKVHGCSKYLPSCWGELSPNSHCKAGLPLSTSLGSQTLRLHRCALEVADMMAHIAPPPPRPLYTSSRRWGGKNWDVHHCLHWDIHSILVLFMCVTLV